VMKRYIHDDDVVVAVAVAAGMKCLGSVVKKLSPLQEMMSLLLSRVMMPMHAWTVCYDVLVV
jgi:hypothetical protein